MVLIHGWLGSPKGDWFPWLKGKLEEGGLRVVAPKMPEPAAPEIGAWVATIDSVVGLPDEETYFVGHSIGCQAILRYLEKIDAAVGGAIFVAGWFSLAPGALEDKTDEVIAKPWLETPIDFKKIRKKNKNFTAIFSDNDPLVPLRENSEKFSKKLRAQIIVEPGQGHFSEVIGGVTEAPVVLKEILAMISQ